MGQEDETSPVTMAELLSRLPSGSRVLDLGCGNGSFPYDSFPNLEIDALDAFPEPPQPFPTHVTYTQGYAEALPYANNVFDLVTANFVLEHVTDFEAAIAQISQVLKIGGYFYMAVPNAASFEDALYRGLYAGGGHLQRHSFESVMATVYRTTGFKLTAYVEWPAGFTFLQDREGLRSVTTVVANACREAFGIDIRSRSNYIFVFRHEYGIGRRLVAAVCTYCGSGKLDNIDNQQTWTCLTCGRINHRDSTDHVSDDTLDADMKVLWNRYPALWEGQS